MSRNFNNKTKLPYGWRWVRLGEVCQQDRQIIEASSEEAKRLLYVSLEHIESQSGKILRNPESLIEDEGKSTTFAFDSRHILFGKLRPYLNKVALPNFEGRCTTEAIPLIPDSRTDRHFIAWILRRKETVDAAMKDKTGSRMPRANMDVLLNLEIPLPPLPEQKRIAAILNEQIVAVEKARAAAEAQYEAAKALPGAQAKRIFECPESSSWTTRQLGEIFAFKSGDFLPAKAMNMNGSYPVYGGNGINGYHDSFMFEEPQLVIGRVGALCGCIHMTQPKSWITDNALYISEKKMPFDNVYMSHYLTYLDLNKLSNSMAQPLISGKLLYPIRVRLPQISEQKRIAAILNEQMAEAEKLKESIDEQLNTTKSLPAALLRQAFSGAL